MSLNVFDLYAKLSLDSKEYEEGLGKAKDGLSKLGVGIGVAVGAAATAVSAVTKSAVEGYAEYEQLVGGVQTLFKSSSDTIMGYAEDAYETAGLTANEYMDTVTSFSASLIQSTGRGIQTDLDMLEASLDEEYTATKRSLEDEYKARQEHWKKVVDQSKYSSKATQESLKKERDEDLKALKRANEDQLKELKAHNKDLLAEAERTNMASVTTEESLARAAQLANMAIIDMSDNANKMGSDMASIQNAYQGFAKQNYTMLDNLKLGYGGTKEEMKRLLQDAEKLTGRKFDVSSYADIVEAIHAVQVEMGIAGTTADEAGSTISGSMKQFQKAWENLVVGFANPDANIGILIDRMVQTGKTALDNLTPIIQQAVKGIATAIKEITPIINKELPNIIMELAPSLIEATASLIASLIAALPMLLTTLFDMLPTIMNTIGNAIQDAWPEIQKAIEAGLQTTSGKIIAGVLGIITAIKAINIVSQVVNLVSGIGTAISALANPVGLIVAAIAAAAILIIANWDKIKQAWEEAKTFFKVLWLAIKDAFREADTWLKDKFTKAWEGVKSAWDKVGDFFENVKNTIVEAFTSLPDRLREIGSNLLHGLWDGISNAVGWLKDKVTGVASSVVGWVEGIFDTHSPSKVFAEIGENLALGLGEGYEDAMSDIKRDIQGISEDAIPTLSVPANSYGGYSYSNGFAGYGGGDIIINIDGSGLTVDEIASELGTAVRRQIRMTGAYL